MTIPDRLEQVLTELETLEKAKRWGHRDGVLSYHWPLLRAKLLAAMEMETTMRMFRNLSYKSPEQLPDTAVDMARWVANEADATLRAWQQAGEEDAASS